MRAARASASIDGGSMELPQPGESGDPILAGALRVAQSLDGDALDNMVATWRRAPLQALARLHLLAAADLVEDAEELGRPRTEPGVADGIVARAASRLVCVASGLDTRNLGVPEVHWMRRLQAYRDGVAGFGAGTVEGVGGWVLFCCGSLEAGAREAGSIAEAFAG